MEKLKVKETNLSYLNTLPESFIRRAFFGLFGKAPSMPTDEQLSLEILLCIVAVVISFGCHQPCATRLSHEQTQNKSIFCIDLQKAAMKMQPAEVNGPTQANVPLPGSASSTPKEPKPGTHGAVPLPGAQPDPLSD